MGVFDVGYGEEEIKNLLSENRLGRNKNLQVMMNFLNNIERNMVLNLDDDWGTGKTVFLKQLEYLGNYTETNENLVGIDKKVIEKFNGEYIVFYFNSWEHDLYDNPLESLLYSLLMKYSELNEEKVVEEQVRNKISSNLRTLGVIGGNFAIKTLSKGLIELDDLKKEKPEDAHPTITSAESKREAINSLIEEILGESDQRLLIIIDELDRCKPKYAINLLEVIKHFFDNNQVVFLFGTNKLELAESISAEYGVNFNGCKYLNKFFDMEFTLPTCNIDEYIELLLGHDEKSSWSMHEVKAACHYFNFTLRDVNKLCSTYNVFINYWRGDNWLYDTSPMVKYLFLVYALSLKIHNMKTYKLFLSGKDLDGVLNYYKSDKKFHDNLITRNRTGEIIPENEIIEMYELFKLRNTWQNRQEHEALDQIHEMIEVLSMMSDRL